MRRRRRGKRRMIHVFSLRVAPSTLHLPAAPLEPNRRCPNPRPSRPEHRPIAFCVIDPRFEATPRKTARIDRIISRLTAVPHSTPRTKRHPFPRTESIHRRPIATVPGRPPVNSFVECGGGRIQNASTFVKGAKRRTAFLPVIPMSKQGSAVQTLACTSG